MSGDRRAPQLVDDEEVKVEVRLLHRGRALSAAGSLVVGLADGRDELGGREHLGRVGRAESKRDERRAHMRFAGASVAREDE